MTYDINKYLNDSSFYEIVHEILENEEFLKRKNYGHHGKISVYEHSLKVSYLAYKIAKKCKLFNYRNVAIGGLLHDFYYEPWQDCTVHKPLFKKHGFVHAKEALYNSYIYFPNLMNNKIENIIERHMFPLNIIPPKHMDAWLIVFIDKFVSIEALNQKEFYKCLLFSHKN